MLDTGECLGAELSKMVAVNYRQTSAKRIPQHILVALGVLDASNLMTFKTYTHPLSSTYQCSIKCTPD